MIEITENGISEIQHKIGLKCKMCRNEVKALHFVENAKLKKEFRVKAVFICKECKNSV